jgi:hypothetical protein
MRLQPNFFNSFKLFLPVQSSAQKHFSSSPAQITSKSFAIPCPQEGRIMIVTDVGCGMRWTRQRRARASVQTNGASAFAKASAGLVPSPSNSFGGGWPRTAKSCGPDAPTLASSFADFFSATRRWQKSPVTGESTKETVKTIAQGMPD